MKRCGTARKHSAKRDAILREIRSSGSHPSAQRVYDALKPAIPNLSLGTVYRNISLFREEGSVASVGVVNGEERFDGRVEPHPHFVCESCGAVIDLEIPPEATLNLSCKMTECIIDKRKTVFYGLCKTCYKASQACNAASLACGASHPSNGANAVLDR